jgi:hypothetical protein
MLMWGNLRACMKARAAWAFWTRRLADPEFSAAAWRNFRREPP